jgi:hypothetical protein
LCGNPAGLRMVGVELGSSGHIAAHEVLLVFNAGDLTAWLASLSPLVIWAL